MTSPSPLHVVHVCCTSAFAGVERHVSELAAAQAATGHRVCIVGGDQTRISEVAGPGVTVLPGDGVMGALASLRRLPGRPHVVNTHLTAADVAAGLAFWLRGVPVVSTRHIASVRGSRRLTRPAVRLAVRRLDRQIAVSQFVASRIEHASTVVLSGVQPDDGRIVAADRRRVVLVAQRLEAEKETDVAIRAFGRSGIAADGWRLEIAGTGSLRTTLEALAASLGLTGSVDFLGFRTDVGELMRTSGALLAPDSDEAFGLSVVEAMARGLPVVASGAGAHIETVGSVPGARLFRPGDADHAARLLAGLAASETIRDDYGADLQAAQRAHFTVAEQARRTEVVYRELV